jgi:hypothetical protein
MAGPCGGDRAADPSDQFTGISRASCELRPQLRCGRGASISWNQTGTARQTRVDQVRVVDP